MSFDFEKFIRTFADQYDPRAQSIGPNWRELEDRERQQQSMAEERQRAEISKWEQAVENQRRDDAARDKRDSFNQQLRETEGFDRERRHSEEMELANRRLEEFVRANSASNEDRDARLQLDRDREVRVAKENEEKLTLMIREFERKGESRPNVHSFGDFMKAGEVEYPVGSKEYPLGGKGWSSEEAVRRLGDYSSMFGQQSFENATKERYRAKAEQKDPSASVQEIEESKADEVSALFDQRAGKAGSGNGKPAFLDLYTPKSSEPSPEITQGLNKFRTAAKGAMQGDSAAAEQLSKMLDERKLREIQEKYGAETVDQLRAIYRETFGRNAEVPF